ncbi:MAG: TonB-dependent receptor plug domain-containing protein [Pseudomonadales bacterium]
MEELTVQGQETTAASEPTELTQQLLKVPGTLGDPLSAIYSLPGVLETDDGEPAVRGSSPRDNAFNIDFLPAAYVFHDFGNSIFNENLIRDFGFQAGGFGAEYGDANGAIFDVTLRDPRAQPIATTIDASFLRAGLMFEGSLAQGHTFYVSARESLVHLLIKAIDDAESEEDDDDIEFKQYPRATDYQAKYMWQPNQHHSVSLLALGASDRGAVDIGDQSDEALIDPGSSGTASLDTEFSSIGANWIFDYGRHYWQTAVGQLDESRRDRFANGDEYLNIDSLSLTAKSTYQFQLNDSIELSTGVEYRDYEVDYDFNVRYRSCSEFSTDCDTAPGVLLQQTDGHSLRTTAFHAASKWAISKRLLVSPGVRWQRTSYLDETHFEPRLTLSWALDDNWTVNGAWGRYHQLPDADEIVPVIGNPRLRSPESSHYLLGLSGKLSDNWFLKTDIYYKDLSKLTIDVDDERNYLNQADGRAYGAELMLRRQALNSPWYAWLSFSYARSERQDLLSSQTTKADYDTPVVAKAVLNYQLGQWNLGARWNYRSGLPFTPIVGNEENPNFPGFYRPVYGELNSDRASSYHRLDLRAEHPFRFLGAEGSYYIDIINAYGRDNGGSVAYKPTPNSSEYTLEKEDSYGLLPSVGIKLTF